MLSFDKVFLVLAIASVVVGLCAGLGRVLKWTIKGIVGKIMAGVLTYFLFGMVVGLPFVEKLLVAMVDKLAATGNFFCNILLALRIELIALAAALFLLVRILQKILTSLVASLLEADNMIMKVVNKVGGVILLPALAFILLLLVFQVGYWLTGPDGAFYDLLAGSTFRLDRLFLNNPLHTIIDTLKHSLDGLRG